MGDKLALRFLGLRETTQYTLQQSHGPSFSVALDNTTLGDEDSCGYPSLKTVRSIVFKYALKNALIPTITIVGLQFARLLSGTIIIETIFGWPGVGRLVAEAVFSRDFPVVRAAVMIIASAVVLMNLFVDLLYGLIDPRIKLQ